MTLVRVGDMGGRVTIGSIRVFGEDVVGEEMMFDFSAGVPLV